ncbi:MAG: hypothetical protein WC686_04370 [Candidatus Shapirobacteria bacterium]
MAKTSIPNRHFYQIGNYLFFVFCLIVQILPVIRSGLSYSYGIGFWGPNGHDGIWHLSLINHISDIFNITIPSFAGYRLNNYHSLYDILVSLLQRVTTLPSHILLFQIVPMVLGILIIYYSYKLGYKLTGQKIGAYLLVLMNCTATSLGWLVSLLRFGRLGGESTFWAMQSGSNQLNPPLALSLLLILILLNKLIDNKPTSKTVLFILIILPLIKVYGAFSAFSLVGIFILLQHSSKTELLSRLFQLFLAAVLALLLFLFYNRQPSALIVFQPFWFIDSMIDSLDRLYLPILTRLRTTQNSHPLFYPKYIFVQTLSIIFFIVGNFSWRLLLLKRLKSITQNKFLVSIFIIALILLLLPLLFIQKGTPWNTIQFLYYSLFFANILLASVFTNYPKRLQLIFFTLIFIFNIAGNFESFTNYLGNPAPAAIPPSEVEALAFLAAQPRGITLAYPYNKYHRRQFDHTPLPLYAYETTAYVSAYGRQPVFLEDEMNLENSQYPFQERLRSSLEFFQQSNTIRDRGFLLNNQIDYIYLTGLQLTETPLKATDLSLKLIFNHPTTRIYKVIK